MTQLVQALRLPSERTRNTIAYYAAFIALGVASAALGPTLPGLSEQVGASTGEISSLFVFGALGFMAGAVAFGRIYDRLPGHPVIVASLLASAAVFFVLPFAPALALVAGLFFLRGITSAGIDVGTNALLVWQYGKDVPPYMNGLHLMFGVGAFLTPLIVAGVLESGFSTPSAFFVLAILMVPAAIMVGRLPSPPIKAQHDESHAGKSEQTDWFIMGLIVLFFITYAGAEISFADWLFTYATRRSIADEVTAAAMTSAFWAAFTAGRIASIPAALRFQPRAILGVGLVGSLIGVGLVLLVDSQAALWVGSVLVGFFIAPIFPTAISFAERRLRLSAKLTSWFFVGAGIGGMILPFIIGNLVESAGTMVIMQLIALDLMIALAVFVTLMIYAERRPV